MRYLLSSDADHMVLEGEGIAMVLGMELLRPERTVRRVSFTADNVSAVQRSSSARASPMQYVWDLFRQWWDMVRRRFRHISLTIRWVPGHEGVAGNEEADRLAKKAVEEGSSAAHRLPAPLRKPIPRSKQAAARAVNDTLKIQARCVWRASPRRPCMDDIDKTMPSAKFLQLTEGLSRHKASLLIQL